jgi:hypothetical protein
MGIVLVILGILAAPFIIILLCVIAYCWWGAWEFLFKLLKREEL